MDTSLPGRIEPNTRVRLIGDPQRIGVATNKVQERRGRIHRQVLFPDRPQYVPEDQLELVPNFETPLDLLRLAKLGRASDLRHHVGVSDGASVSLHCKNDVAKFGAYSGAYLLVRKANAPAVCY